MNVVTFAESPARLRLDTKSYQNPVWKIEIAGEFSSKPECNITTHDYVTLSVIETSNSSENTLIYDQWIVCLPNSTEERSLKLSHEFEKRNGTRSICLQTNASLQIETSGDTAFPMAVSVTPCSQLSQHATIMAGCVLLFLYVLIISDVVDRTLASMMGATAAISCLTLIGSVSISTQKHPDMLKSSRIMIAFHTYCLH